MSKTSLLKVASAGANVEPAEFAFAWVAAREPYTAIQHRAYRDIHAAIARAFAGLADTYRGTIHQAIANEHGRRAEARLAPRQSALRLRARRPTTTRSKEARS